MSASPVPCVVDTDPCKDEDLRGEYLLGACSNVQQDSNYMLMMFEQDVVRTLFVHSSHIFFHCTKPFDSAVPKISRKHCHNWEGRFLIFY